jgi:translation initiation factor IF-2
LALRIYALAKELKLDSKELVDLCAKAGVTGKGSALASLTDEEVQKIKSFLSGTGAKSAPTAASARPSVEPKASPSTTFRREDYIAPGGVTNKPPVLGTKTEARPPEREKRRPAADAPKQPSIRLAAMPTTPTPPPATPAEPPAQKPDIRLPADAIRAGKIGSKPLSEHLRKHEMRRKADGARGTEPEAPPTPGRRAAVGIPAMDAPSRERARKGRTNAPAAGGEEFDASLGGREQRQLKRKRVTPMRGEDEDGVAPSTPVKPTRIHRTGTNTAAPRKSAVVLELPCTVRTFSESLGIPARQVLAKLLQLGTMGNINAQISPEMAELLAIELGVEVSFKQQSDVEQDLLTSVQEEDDPALLEPRAPVVTFLGHVDHGKTSLLDRIIGTNVAAGESGGITQHIRAYKITKEHRAITFVDTPGHEAFTAMRARGANVTDIAVIVVAADDGVMPQTEEAISHARAAGVPMVVALNKMDLPGVNIDRIYQQLAAAELLPTAWGGDTEVVQTSALTGAGIDELLDTLLTIAELHDLRANPHRAAYGTCLEAELHEGRGVIAKVLTQRGTLHVGDAIVCGAAYGRVKALFDTLRPNVRYEEVGPSTPVNLTGLNEPPAAGEHLYAVDDIAVARKIAEARADQMRRTELTGGQEHVTLENLFDRLGQSEVQTLNLILRADTRGSIEAIKKELGKLVHPEVQIRILQATVGGITEADVHLADASDAVIIGFNVVPEESARALAEQTSVQIRRYDIIYQVTEDLKKALEGMLKPEEREVESGRALVLRLFVISRVGTIAGCRVLSGTIERNSRMRVIRENRVIGDYAIDSLRREKDDAREVREGYECGIKLANFNDLKEGDILECYKIEEIARTL